MQSTGGEQQAEKKRGRPCPGHPVSPAVTPGIPMRSDPTIRKANLQRTHIIRTPGHDENPSFKMPNSLSLSLTESVLFLRAVHIAHQHPSTHDNAPPSILRALLILSLAKPTRISSIEVELVAQSVTIWTEGTAILSAFSRYIGLRFLQAKARVTPQSCRRRTRYFLPPVPFSGRPILPLAGVPSPSILASLTTRTKTILPIAPVAPHYH